jgi:hypothetical protein
MLFYSFNTACFEILDCLDICEGFEDRTLLNVYCNFRSKKGITLYKTSVATALVAKAKLFQLLVGFRLLFIHKILCEGNIEEFLT